MLLNCGVGEDSWESLGLLGDPTSQFWRRSVLSVHWKNWCWSLNSNTSARKRPWYWERFRAGGEGDNRGWDGWMASPSQWTWVWVNSGSWWWTGRPGVLQFMESQSWTWLSDRTELNWTEVGTQYTGIQYSEWLTIFKGLSFIYSYKILAWSSLVGTVDRNMPADAEDTG